MLTFDAAVYQLRRDPRGVIHATKTAYVQASNEQDVRKTLRDADW
jgi:hypothetical protein